MYAVKEIAARLNLSTRAIYRAVEAGDLEHHRFGAQIRVSEEQLGDFLDRARINSSLTIPVITGELIRKHLDA